MPRCSAWSWPIFPRSVPIFRQWVLRPRNCRRHFPGWRPASPTRTKFKADPSIKVVSSQPTSWDANKAGEITTTVLQQHPNLCGILSVWGPQAAGAVQVIKAAGKSGTTKIYVASDGQPADCDLLAQGGFYRNLSNRADPQAEATA